MDKGLIFEKLIHLARKNGLQVKFCPLRASYGRLKGDRVAIASDADISGIIHALAHELSHLYLHFDKGDTINSDRHSEYEEQADRAAQLLLDVLECEPSQPGAGKEAQAPWSRLGYPTTGRSSCSQS